MDRFPSIILLLCLLSLPEFTKTQTAPAADGGEVQTLLKINQELGNPLSLRSWSTASGHHCSWTGIQCVDGYVTGILLQNGDITGAIPSVTCDLKNLAQINLYNNSINSGFPASLYDCSNLQILNISQNYFVGPLPIDIGRMTSLRSLDLSGNNFTGDVTASIGRLQALEILFLHENLFNGSLAPEIGDLVNLEELRLSDNPFQPARIPKEFGRLQKLKQLWMMQSNLIGEIPQSFSNLGSLEHLDLSENNLNGAIPGGIFRLKKLRTLYLFKNQLSEAIPNSVEALDLVDIDMSMNSLSGSIPADFGRLMNLTKLSIYSNRLSGEIPRNISRLPALFEIRLFMNNLSGELPPDLGVYSKLQKLEVSDNQLSGKLPPNLCRGGELYALVAFSNNLNGELPESLGNCETLYGIHLYKNNFSGDVPVGLWSVSDLKTLWISENSFSGQLPQKLAPNLERLEISDNQFSGPIPSRIFESKSLMVFTASNNLFSGQIPTGLTRLAALETLLLDGNRISGDIPSKIGMWKSLSVLDLSRNNLTGRIPPQIGSLPVLNSLDLSGNQLSGPIPSDIGHLKLSKLNLSSNQLTGPIPSAYEIPAFGGSFLNNPGLCASVSALRLRPCNSKPRDHPKPSPLFVLVISVVAAVVSVAAVAFALFAMRDFWKKSTERVLHTWKLTSFSRFGFTESEIRQGLTEGNLIGSGSTGRVYRIATGNGSGEVVAVKMIGGKPAGMDRRLEKEFQAEVEVLSRIRHANIVKLICCISTGDSKLVIYEFMENGSLDRWIHQGKAPSGMELPILTARAGTGRLDWPTRYGIAVGAAQGLCYMHHSCSPAIIHRDVKSSNILLDADFKARIADFGLARMLAERGAPESMSVVAGSLGYMPPEYGYSVKLSEKADVYSFGVVLLELVTGRQANEGYDHTSLAEWAWKVMEDAGKYPTRINIRDALQQDVVDDPAHLKEMCMVFKLGLMCTRPSPKWRPSMKEVLESLLRCRANQQCSHGLGTKPSSEYDAAPLLP